MGNLSLGIGLAAGAGFYLYRKFTRVNEQEENSENSASQSATQEALEDDDPTKEDLGDVSMKDDTTTVFTNETQIEVQRMKEDASSLQNGVEKQQETSTRNPTERLKTAEKKHQTKKSNFGGLRKGFLLYIN